MSIAGKVRLSATLRSRMISELPVPLNSSKITSSMREPVSMRAVAMMVSEPFLDVAGCAEETLRALQRIGVDAAREHLAGGRHDRVVGPAEAGYRVEEDDHVAAVLHEALRLLDHHFGDLHVPARRLVEGGGHDLALHRGAACP